MTFESLTSTAAIIKAKEDLELTNNELVNLKLVEAKEQMKWDLTEILRYEIDSSDMTDFITNNLDYIQNLLALKQLALYWFSNRNGAGSANDTAFKAYDKEYKERLAKAGSFKYDTVLSHHTVRIER